MWHYFWPCFLGKPSWDTGPSSLISVHWWCSLGVSLGLFSSYHIILGRHSMPTISSCIYNLMTQGLLLHLGLPSLVTALTGLLWLKVSGGPPTQHAPNLFTCQTQTVLPLTFPFSENVSTMNLNQKTGITSIPHSLLLITIHIQSLTRPWQFFLLNTLQSNQLYSIATAITSLSQLPTTSAFLQPISYRVVVYILFFPVLLG